MKRTGKYFVIILDKSSSKIGQRPEKNEGHSQEYDSRGSATGKYRCATHNNLLQQ